MLGISRAKISNQNDRSLPENVEVVKISQSKGLSEVKRSGMNDLSVISQKTESVDDGDVSIDAGVLTSNKSWKYYSAIVSEYCAVLENKRVFVSTSHKNNPAVVLFLNKLSMNDIIDKNPEITLVSLSMIKQINSQQARRSAVDSHAEEDTANFRRKVLSYIKRAFEAGASDIHFVQDSIKPRVEIRVNKILVHLDEETYDTLDRILSVAFVMCDHEGESSYDRKKTQYARLDASKYRNHLPKEIDSVRFAWSPIYKGRYLVGRIVEDTSNKNSSFDTMGYSAGQIKILHHYSSMTKGVVLFCGSVNSGKSTTLRAMAARKRYDFNGQISVVSVEDPPEGIIPYVKQIAVAQTSTESDPDDAKVEDRFIPYIKVALRQDLNVFIVGEIRSLEALKIALEACVSGNQVFSTLHANSVIEAFMRMLQMGVEPYFLGNHRVLTGLVAQRLIPKICPHCKISVESAFDHNMMRESVYTRLTNFLGRINLSTDHIYHKGPGCSHCHRTGYKGLTLAAEMISTNREFLSKASTPGSLYEAEDYWLTTMGSETTVGVRGFTQQSHAISKMLLGEIGPEEVELEGGPIEWEENMKGLFSHGNIPGKLHPDIAPVGYYSDL